MEVITICFLGESGLDVLESMTQNLPKISDAMFSLPFRLPWPLSRTPLARLPVLNFGRGMDARNEILEILRGVIAEHRLEKESGRGQLGGVIDELLARQDAQREQGGEARGEMALDDAFVCDNVSGFTGEANEVGRG